MTRLRSLILASAIAASSLGTVVAHAQVNGPYNGLGYHQQQWHRGDRFTGSRHVVGDWRRHHLTQPPRGYSWIQNGGGYLLIGPNGKVDRVWGG